MNNNSKVLGALLVGAAAGVAISLFLTSEKGIELRQTLATKARDFMTDLKEKVNEGKGMVSDLTDKVASSAENVAQKAAASVISKVQSNMYI
jgi:gas vesicle protein